MSGKIESLESNIASLQYLLFAKKSERLKEDPLGMRNLFDEVEISVEEKCSDKPLDKETQVGSHIRKINNKKPLPDELPRKRIEHELESKDKVCSKHNCERIKIGESKTEKLEIVPASVCVEEHVTFTYKCPCCAKEAEYQGESQAPTLIETKKEPSLIPKSFASPSLLAYVATAKYCDALPLCRQENIFARHGILLNRNTMASWMIKSYLASIPVLNLLYEDLIACQVVGADETTIQVLKESDRNPSQKSYMWCAKTMHGPSIIYYKYDPGRSAIAAKNFLQDFEGTLVCDGLKSYDSYASTEKVILAGCMAHAR